MAVYLARHPGADRRPSAILAALRSYRRLRRWAALLPPSGANRYRAGYLDTVDPLLREPLRGMLDAEYAAEPAAEHAAPLARSLRLADWIAAPLRAPETPADVTPLEEITADGETLGIILRAEFRRPGVHFFTPDAWSQQMAHLEWPAGHVIRAHAHRAVDRKIERTQEALWLRRGRVRVDFYRADRTCCARRELRAGDVLLLVGGGHGLEMLEDSELVEIKQGPYAAGEDKTFFDP